MVLIISLSLVGYIMLHPLRCHVLFQSHNGMTKTSPVGCEVNFQQIPRNEVRQAPRTGIIASGLVNQLVIYKIFFLHVRLVFFYSWCVKRREFSGMIPVITSDVIIPATPSNPSMVQLLSMKTWPIGASGVMMPQIMLNKYPLVN